MPDPCGQSPAILRVKIQQKTAARMVGAILASTPCRGTPEVPHVNSSGEELRNPWQSPRWWHSKQRTSGSPASQ